MPLTILLRWCVLVGLLGLIGYSGAEHWYVSLSGRGFPCGSSKDAACSDLTSAIDQANDADVIHVDGSATGHSEIIYSWCKRSEYQILGKSLAVIGYNGQPRIGCGENTTLDTIVEIKGSMSTGCKVVLQNLQLESGVLVVSNCVIELVETTVIDVSIRTKPPCDSVLMSIDQSAWFGRLNSDVPSSQHYTPPTEISCNVTNINITRSHFYQTLFTIKSDQEMSAYVADNVFSNTEEGPDRMGGLRLQIKVPKADVFIKDTLFEQQLSPTRIDSLISLHYAALMIRSTTRQQDEQLTSNNASVVIDNVKFKNNERGFSIVGPFQRVEATNCLFVGNTVKHGGGAVIMYLSEDTTAEMNNCTFVNNSAGKIRHNYRNEDPTSMVTYEGNVMHVNSNKVSGRVGLVGKGGAIRLGKGKLNISNSIFINNTASMFGGSIFVEIDSNIILNNISFENSPTDDNSDAVNIFYSYGKCTVNGVKMINTKAYDGRSVFYHSGSPWSMTVGNLYIQCPTGFNLQTINSSSLGISHDGMRQAHALDNANYFCKSCSRNKYSLDFGYLNHTLSCKEFAHYILVFHHEMPDPNHIEVYNHHRIQCMDCPYGGECENGIKSRRNFWGFKHRNSSIAFRQCPNNYCCTFKNCQSYNSCARNRHGRLCGRCGEGYSDTIFSTGCVPDTACSSAWFWLLILLISVLYCLFLLFVPELKKFVFAGPGCISSFLQVLIRKSHFGKTTIVMSELDHAESENARLQDCDEDHRMRKSLQPTVYMILLYFYVQDALLLHIDESQDDPITKSIFQSLVTALFTFQMNFPFAKEVCVAVGMTPVMKVFVQLSIPLIVLSIFVIVYSIIKVKVFWSGSYAPNSNGRLNKFRNLLVLAYIHSLLVFFQPVAISTFKLLKCVNVESDKVLYIDGTLTCFQSWQYGILTYALVCIIPLCIVFCVGPSLVRKGSVPLWQFLLGCVFPLPLIIWWLIQSIQHKGRLLDDQIPPSGETKAVLENLQGPFRENSTVHWNGILLGGRLVLVLFSVSINDVLIKITCMLVLCVLLLLVHNTIKPYKNTCSNLIGILAAFTLVILSGINVIQAGFHSADYIPIGPLALLRQVLYHTETVLLVLTPCIIVLILVSLLIIETSVFILKKLHTHFRRDSN